MNTCKKCKVPYEEHSCYWSPCVGCKDGHSSFWKTVTESPQWIKWRKKQSKDMEWDVDECQECGWISHNHFQAFISFCIKK